MDLLQAARQFFLQLEGDWSARLQEVEDMLHRTGSYSLTTEELGEGAKMAWRNSNRCIGRLFWQTLHVIDARDAKTFDDVYARLVEHLHFATNGGKIRSTMTVLPNEFKLLNTQLIRYAGYETPDGIIGDPMSVPMTKRAEQLGWVGVGTPFDMLPLMITDGQDVRLYDLPSDAVLEVEIIHEEFDLFDGRPIKWHAVPAIADMELEIGGLRFTSVPFNGWYMETEIGARNLADTNRYDLLPLVGRSLGLDTSKERSLWRDRALVELNIAVLQSFERAGVTIVDHHTAAKQFKRFEKNEREAGRDVTGQWSWLIPPLSPATTHVFHEQYDNIIKTPNLFARSGCPFSGFRQPVKEEIKG
ncbi:nitric oxide synthase oxygenase [Exiguobacterium sp. MMG028]|uniref:nitric oxide synthase oxygenase n=1 Tax=Exiguobacterium sp. MMG028 TaxID=3021979 RepID=UPI0022FEFFB4|nr:nitric oxide synthase oxygenase [Exiguobacterium sp. MMG028]MDA5560684.1 nitric oxide synthase oxygenase [Exiguobacterium sp. MMG028]